MAPRDESLTSDPVWYITGGVFALLTTLVPGALGQRWLMPFLQTTALFLLLLPAIRRAQLRPVLGMLAIWVSVQALAVLALTWAAPGRAEVAVGNGFAYQASLLSWLYTQSPLPASWATQPALRVVELAGVTVGAALTGGLAGIWFLLRSLTLYAFGIAAAWNASGTASAALGAAEPWWPLRIVAYTLLIAVLAMPGFTGEYNVARWPLGRRRVFWWGIGLLAAALLVEALLSTPWATWWGSAA